MIEISLEDYEKLVEDSLMLNALLAAGIEDLPVYEVAKDVLKQRKDE